ncbi:MAG: outer membrane lipoprotein carrier protein LolA [Bryobacteraceae bacterium]
MIFFLAAVSAPAATGSLKELLDSVEKRYNRSQTLQVQFTETYSAMGRAPKTESGTLYLRKPGRMRWDYAIPRGKVFLGDGKNFYLYTPSNNQVEKVRAKESEDMRAPLAFLLGKLNFDRDFRSFRSRPEGGGQWVIADPKSANLPYTKVEFLVMPDARIERVRVTGHDLSTLDFRFDDERVNPRLDAKLFQFTAPSGAKVVLAGEN